MPKDPDLDQRTLHYWLRVVLKEARGATSLREIGELVHVDGAQIGRFESGETRNPARADEYLAAYAKVLDMDDPRDFYDRALERWRSEGEPPVVKPAETPAAVGEEVADQLEQMPPADAPSRPRRKRRGQGS